MSHAFKIDEDVVLECTYQNNLLPELFPDAPKTVTYKGKVIHRKPYDDPHSIRIFTGEKEMMIRVIKMKNIVKVNGQPFSYTEPFIPQVQKEKYVLVKGSTGKEYKITIYPNGKLTCTCPGFGFRQKCNHIEKFIETARAT